MSWIISHVEDDCSQIITDGWKLLMDFDRITLLLSSVNKCLFYYSELLILYARVYTFCLHTAIIIRDNRQMDTLTGWSRVTPTRDHFPVMMSTVIMSTVIMSTVRQMWHHRVPVSTRAIYKVSPCDHRKMDNRIQSGCLYLDFRLHGVKATAYSDNKDFPAMLID